MYRAGQPETVSPPTSAAVVDDEFPVETPVEIVLPHLATSRKMLFVAVAATLAFVRLLADRTMGLQRASKLQPCHGSAGAEYAGENRGFGGGPKHFGGAARISRAGRFRRAICSRRALRDRRRRAADFAEAVRWFSKAAEQGNVMAQSTLGAYYWAGRGVPRDLDKAYFWSVLAEAEGDATSKYRVAVLASRMTHGQILAAQQQAKQWIGSIQQRRTQRRRADPAYHSRI